MDTEDIDLDGLPMVGDATVVELADQENVFGQDVDAFIETTLTLSDRLTGGATLADLSEEDCRAIDSVVVDEDGNKLALEGYNGRYEVMMMSVATEGFKDFVRNTWERIKKAFRVLLNFIKDSLARIFSNLTLIRKAAYNVQQKANKLKRKAPANGQKISIVSNKYLFANGKYQEKGVQRVHDFLTHMNETIPDAVSGMVSTLVNNLTSGQSKDDLKDIARLTTSVTVAGTKFAPIKVPTSESPIKRTDVDVYRTDVIAANKALFVCVGHVDDNKEAEDQIKAFNKSFDLQLATVPNMGKPGRGLEKTIRNANQISGDMGLVIRAVDSFKKADDIMGSIRKSLDKAVNQARGVADDERLPDDRRRYVRTNLNTLFSCRRLIGSNIVGSYALCASVLKAHVKQARKEVNTYGK